MRQGMVIFGSAAFTCCFDFVVVFFLIVKCVIEYFNLRTNLLLVAVIAGFSTPLLIEIVTASVMPSDFMFPVLTMSSTS